MSWKNKIRLLLSCVAVCFTLNGLNYYFYYLPLKQQQADNLIQQLQISYQVIIDEFYRSGRLIYDHIIATPGFMPLYHRANSPDIRVKDAARKELLAMFTPYYKNLVDINIRQLHFHLPDCESFLRFHKPDRFGDNLTSIRYSLVRANRDLSEVVGFEEGRVPDGFRYVFPIVDKGRHLGSVEISLSFAAIKKELQKLHKDDYTFVLRKSIVDSKAFPSEKSFYKASGISRNFMVERDAKISPLVTNINNTLRPDIQQNLMAHHAFVEKASYNGNKYAITFLPINNVQGKPAAYIISYAPDQSLLDINKRLLITTLLISTVVILAFFSFFLLNVKNRTLALSMASQRKTLSLLQDTEHNFNRIFRNNLDAVLLIADHTVVDCNDAMVQMLGAENREQIIDNPIAEFSPETQGDGQSSSRKAEEMIAIARQNGFHRFECEQKKIDGTLFPVMVSLTVLMVQGKELIHMVWQDISVQKKHEHHLLEIADQARAASQAKDVFLANMSHEIRTPMNGILGLAMLLKEMELGNQANDLLDKLLYSAGSLLGLLNDILDFSKIEAGQLSLENHNFNLATMMDCVFSSLSYMAADNGLFLRDNSDYGALPAWIKSDDLRLKQILTNRISNAIKFTETGGVTVEAKLDQINNDTITLHFTVSDTGIGIPPSKQHDIFKSFTQAESSTARQFGGTGLGLAISRQLVEMMGGEIRCKSVPGEGTVFSFTVVVKQGVEEVISEKPAIDFSYDNLHILLAEDNKINQQIAVSVLEQGGSQVLVAENGMEVLRLLTRNDFDLIIMDIQMPEMDGLLATTIIRKCERADGNAADISDLEEELMHRIKGCHIPIIAMTANAMSGEREKCLKAGVDDYITKPFMPEDIHRALNALALSDKLGGRRISDKTNSKKARSNSNAHAHSHLKHVYDLDGETITRLLKRACDDVAALQTDLSEALSRGDDVEISTIALGIKKVFLNLGLDHIAETAQNIKENTPDDLVSVKQHILKLDHEIDLFFADNEMYLKERKDNGKT